MQLLLLNTWSFTQDLGLELNFHIKYFADSAGASFLFSSLYEKLDQKNTTHILALHYDTFAIERRAIYGLES